MVLCTFFLRWLLLCRWRRNIWIDNLEYRKVCRRKLISKYHQLNCHYLQGYFTTVLLESILLDVGQFLAQLAVWGGEKASVFIIIVVQIVESIKCLLFTSVALDLLLVLVCWNLLVRLLTHRHLYIIQNIQSRNPLASTQFYINITNILTSRKLNKNKFKISFGEIAFIFPCRSK